MYNYYTANGYDVRVTVGFLTIDTKHPAKQNGLCDDLSISYVVGGDAQATFSFIPPEGPVYLELYQSNPVTIFFKKAGVWTQVYSGKVVTPSIDFISRKITLECSDNRKSLIKKLPKAIVQGVGSYSTTVFGKARDLSDELEKRLQTVSGDFDFDRYGNYYLTPWAPKAIADYVFTPADIYYLNPPRLTYSNRTDYINTINIKVGYSYQRLHQQTVAFNWPGYTDFLRDFWNKGQPSFPGKDIVQSATQGAGWQVSSTGTGVLFTDLWAAQGFPNGSSSIIWQPNDSTQTLKGRTKFAGYLKTNAVPPVFVTVGSPAKLVPVYKPVLDTKGNQVMDVVKTVIRDTSSHLCRGAVWTSALKFTQNITEEWNLQLRAPQGIAQAGAVADVQTYSLQDPYDTNKWEASNTIAQVSYNFYSDYKTKVAEQRRATSVALNIARCTLLKQYRDVTLSWQFVYLQPQLDLRNTIQVTIDQTALGDTASIAAKGRVYSINHRVNFSSTEASTVCTLKLSRLPGSASTTLWTWPDSTQDPSYIGVPTTIVLGTYTGKDPDTTPGGDKWTGWIANSNSTNAQGVIVRTSFNEQFRIDFPAVKAALRDDLVYYGDKLFDLSIPNDDLAVST